MVFAADEYYLLAGRPFPPAEHYDDFEMLEDGIGMARAFEKEFTGLTGGRERAPGFFQSVDGAPALGYRAPRAAAGHDGSGCGVGLAVAGSVTDGSASTATSVRLGAGVRPPRSAPVVVLTGELGAPILAPLVESTGRTDVRVLPVQNRFFGGNVGVTGLMVGEDVARVLADQPTGHRYLLPDVCLSNGRFLDGMQPEDLPRAVEVVATDGASLREALSIVGAGR